MNFDFIDGPNTSPLVSRPREHGWVHKLRLVFYEAEKIKRFDWLIYPSRLLLSSIFERASS